MPLWIAFVLGRRAATTRYTYGYGQAEDLAGVFIVLMIAASAGLAGWESVQRLLDPQPISNLGWVMVAAVVGFAGNELVAIFRIRVGREIGSAALVADGYHARADGFTSLAVLFGALGVLLGFPIADPLVGLGITVAILFVLKDAALGMWHRLMDAADPGVVEALSREAASVRRVRAIGWRRRCAIACSTHSPNWRRSSSTSTRAATRGMTCTVALLITDLGRPSGPVERAAKITP